MTPKTRSILRKLGLVALLVALAAVLIYVYFLAPPKSVLVYDVMHLNKAWTAKQRQDYYHTSQGSHLIPYAWFIALEQWNNEKLIIDPAYVTRFRLIPDVDSENNPDLLPVGFARDVTQPTDPPNPLGKQDYVGINCAGCHTEELTYKGMGVRIDGAPGQLELTGFLEAIVAAFEATRKDDLKFDRFARRVLGNSYGDATKGQLKAQMATFASGELQQIKDQFEVNVESFLEGGPGSTHTGFGRIDALGQGGNVLFGKLSAKNLRVLDGPVNVLPLWYAYSYGWVQSNSSIRQPMARNLIEAMAVNAALVIPKTPDGDYPSSARLENSWKMEELAAQLKAPEWPGGLFGRIDPDKKARGQVLYGKLCAGCHQPQLETPTTNDPQWAVLPGPYPPDPVSQAAGLKFYHLRLFDVDMIGTDPNDAVNFATRYADATAMGLSANEWGPKVIYPVIAGIMATYYKNHNTPAATQQCWNGDRSNYWRAPKAYPARPLAGVWATAPYLHNGSVPNLYELLSPVAERSATFYTGNVEFDPLKVGFETDRFKDGFKFETSKPGNSNAGHEFTDDRSRKGRLGPQLSKDERWQLVEFLKALRFEDEVSPDLMPSSTWPQSPKGTAGWTQGCPPSSPSPGATGQSPQPQGAAWAQPSPAPTP